MSEAKEEIEEYNGLEKVEISLPGQAYWDPRVYENELTRVWYRNWIYVGRASSIKDPRDFRVFEIGTQQVLILRDEEGELRAFHNTCRHRGTILTEEKEGCFRGPLITCPYHRWAYDFKGNLQKTPTRRLQDDFNKTDYPLYDVGVKDWNGFLFVHLAPEEAAPLEENFTDAHCLDNWSLADLQVGHTYEKTLACNWKIFWENFSECLHCPNIHPELSRIVPLYKQSLMEIHDDPEWQEHQGSGNKLFKPGLTEGMESWSADGSRCAENFPHLTPEEIENGHTYCDTLPSAFIVGHVDYVRVVRVLPLGPEKTAIHAQWLFSPETLQSNTFDPDQTIAFGEKLIQQDGAISELNQRGLRSIRHEQGVLMAEEYYVHAFHNWLKSHFD